MSEIYIVTVTFPNGQKETLESSDDWDLGTLLRALEKCEIEEISIKLAPIK